MFNSTKLEGDPKALSENGTDCATRIRICFVISRIEATTAGTEGHLLRQVTLLKRLGFEPSLIVLQKSDWTEQTTIDDVPIHVMGFRSFRRPVDWRIFGRVTKLLIEINPDIVELYFTEAHFVGSLASRLAKVPVTLSCRRDMGYQYGKKELLMSRIGNRFTDRFIANSSTVADHIAKTERIPRDRFEVIYNGIDLEDFDRQCNLRVSREFETMSKGKQVVCLAANLRPIKNIKLLVDAARIVLGQRKDIIFVVLGSGNERDSLEQYANTLNVAEYFLWQGVVPTIAPYIKRSNITCLTSDSEGFSNSVIEYMAASKPVVATRVGGLPEAIIDGETGFLIEPGDFNSLANKILLLLGDTDLRNKLGDCGRRRIESHFTAQKQFFNYRELYRKLVSNTGPGHHQLASRVSV